MDRRQFSSAMALASLSAFLPQSANAQASRLRPWTNPPLDLMRKRMRPLANAGTLALPSDNVVGTILERWLKRVRLGRLNVGLSASRQDMYQMVSLLPNIQAYVARLHDARTFVEIVQRGGVKSPVLANWLANNKNLDLPYGSFFWIRRVLPNKQGNPAKPFRIHETYWLIIWRRVNNVLFPAFHVTPGSVGFYRVPKAPTQELHRKFLEDVPAIYLDPQSALIPWHSMARALNLSNNIFYNRASFRSANYAADVWGRQTRPANATASSQKGTVVFKRDGVYENKPWSFSLDLGSPQPPHPYAGLETVLDLRAVPSGASITSLYGPQVSTGFNGSSGYPTITRPSPRDLNDAHKDGREFIAVVEQNSNGGAKYAGGSHFAVGLEVPAQGAAEQGLVGSAPNAPVGISAGVVLTASGLPAAGAAVGAISLVRDGMAAYHAAKYGWWLKELAEEARNVARGCALDHPGDYEACRDCVNDAGTIEQARQIHEDMALESAGANALSGAASGCIGGGLGGIAGGPAAMAVGCAVGALVGLGVAAVFGLVEYWEYKSEVDDFKHDAYEPCRETSHVNT